MHTFPYLRVPLKQPHGLTPGSVPAFGSRIMEVPFRRRVLDFNNEMYLIYECIQPGCRGCGCPSFRATTELPKDIWEHLSRHAAICEGLVRSSVPK